MYTVRDPERKTSWYLRGGGRGGGCDGVTHGSLVWVLRAEGTGDAPDNVLVLQGGVQLCLCRGLFQLLLVLRFHFLARRRRAGDGKGACEPTAERQKERKNSAEGKGKRR